MAIRRTLVCILVFSLLAVTACSRPPEVPSVVTPSPAAEQNSNAAYPYPDAEALVPTYNPYPDPAMQPATPVAPPTPTADPALGMVTGRLLQGNQVAKDVSLYLAEIKADAKGNELVASFSAGTSPRTETGSDGSFVFVNIKPGRYAMILYTGLNGFLMNKPETTKQPITFTVEGGKTVELGDLAYDSLPLPTP